MTTLHDRGLIHKWEKDYAEMANGRGKRPPYRGYQEPDWQLKLEHFYSAFVIWICGIVISLVWFGVFENHGMCNETVWWNFLILLST